MQAVGNTPEEFAAFIQKDIATWKAVAAAAKVAVEYLIAGSAPLRGAHGLPDREPLARS